MRAEKKFKEADESRKRLLERSIELLDHKGRTAWVKREKTRRWSVDNREDQVREANRNLETELMQIVRQTNLNAHLPRDRRPSISELVDILITNRVIPKAGRSREFADTITRLGDKAPRGEQITKEEFVDGDYTLAIAWFEMQLDDMKELQQ